MPTIHSRENLWGAILWIGSAQFFIVQAIAQAAWTTPYSLTGNYISDLGNTVCAAYPPRSYMYVCSPRHDLMNASFLLQGAILMLGAWLSRAFFPENRLRDIGLTLIGVAGLGMVLVGFAPENVNNGVHVIGAALDFFAGNIGLVCLGLLLKQGCAPSLKRMTLGFGVLGLVGLILFGICNSRHVSLGLGLGGWERVVAYPLPVWTILMGINLLLRRSNPRFNPTSEV